MNAQHKLKSLVEQLNTVIVGKPAQIQDCVACLLAGGHLLIDDVPGVGKTTLAHALSRTFGLQFSRVQFTSDLMPSDLSGVSVYERGKEAFVFHPGPIFAQVLLADEINRASPKTQSALLEAMEEKQVTVEGETRPLPEPFFVIATQNPLDQIGTYALPESQLDRFLMRISLGYPDRAAERALLSGEDRRNVVDKLPSLLTLDELHELQRLVLAVHAADPLLDYVQDLIAATRSGQWFVQGLSPRAGIAVIRAAKAQALLSGRDYVAPDDVQAILPQAVAHRMLPFFSLPSDHGTGSDNPWGTLGLLAGAAGFEALAVWIEADAPAVPWSFAWELLHGLAEWGVGAVLLWRAWGWARRQSLRNRLLRMFFLGFVWLGLAFVLHGAARWIALSGEPQWGLGATHALGMGCFASLMLAMVTRVSAGHSGRAQVAENAVWVLFCLLQVAVVLRLIAVLAGPSAPHVLLLAAALWAAAVLEWARRLASWYGRLRPDGRAG